MRYLMARISENVECETYKTYMTSCAKTAVWNTAGMNTKGATIQWTYDEFKKRVKEGGGKVETRTGEEVIEHMKGVLRGMSNERI